MNSRQKILCTLALVCLALTGCGGQTSTAAPTESAPAPASVPTPGPVVFIGDSITFAWELPASYVNSGIPGETSSDMLARFQSDVLDLHPSVVSILAGTNDLRYSAAPTVDSILKMATEASAAGACVILSTIPPNTNLAITPSITSQAQMDQVIAIFNERITYFATLNGYQLADYHAVMVNEDGTENAALFIYDGVHPTAAGYAAMWSVVQPLITQCQLGEVPG